MSSTSLYDPEALPARRDFVRVSAANIVRSGDALWVFGLVEDSPRRAFAIATQTAGSLAAGTVNLLEARNWYAASALLRQLIETEYLVWLFGEDPNECVDWLRLTDERSRARFRPARLRRRAAGKFADAEYWTHCEIGGHPHPRGSNLLPERLLVRPNDEGLEALLWLETAAHIQRYWTAFEWTLDVLKLGGIVTIRDARSLEADAVKNWWAADPLGCEFVRGMAKSNASSVASAG